ncbi:MAG TPA: hypothetical protein VNE62_06315, partial [Actinomycetota bacterium]|nr:hypothetical protein [Actinomycetota bacterium]
AKSSFAGVHFVHVEVYNGAPPNHAPAVQEWKLPGEPWIVFVGADGLVKARWSGAMGQSELEKALPKLVDGSLGATAGA